MACAPKVHHRQLRLHYQELRCYILEGRLRDEPMPTREMALAAYRHLLRSTKIAFEGMRNNNCLRQAPNLLLGDLPRLYAARRAARDGFESNESLSFDSKEATESIQHAEDVSRLLRENLVQGRVVEGKENSYSEKALLVSCGNPYELTTIIELRIHEHIERGDNESIKLGADKNPLAGVKCSTI